MPLLTEADIERMALDELHALGWNWAFGPDLSPVGARPERESYGDVVLTARLRSALVRINPELPTAAIDEAMRQILLRDSPSLIDSNRRFHRMITDGVDVSWMSATGERHDKVWLVDIRQIDRNDWLAVNQFTVIENRKDRRPDLVLFVNGLPLVVFEFKNAMAETSTLRRAHRQFQTYLQEIPSLFAYNAFLVISNGTQARFGTLSAAWDRFMPWRTISGDDLYHEPGNNRQQGGISQPGLITLTQGMLERRRFLDYCLNFITFEGGGDQSAHMVKKAAGYHQYHAVNQAVASTLNACGIQNDADALYGRFIEAQAADPFAGEPRGRYQADFNGRRAGVIWHTQGSGKSLSMVFYAGKIIRHPAMQNPTIVVLTDRNDLDLQLYQTFCANQGMIRQTPVQASSRQDLRALLQVASGGVIFTTIQKFLPLEPIDGSGLLSDRANIVVIADEAHRSQYDFIDGLARHLRDALPNASFIGFTGTPIERDDRNTRAVFGDYISIYDIQRAVEDGSTVPIYYESRLARIDLDEQEKPILDSAVEEITEAEEDAARRQRLKSKWASLEALVGAEKRVRLVTEDLVRHFETRQAALVGKGMIVCMSRRICVAMYQAITSLRPEWHSDDDRTGRIKVVMTGSASDPVDWQPHIPGKPSRELLAQRFKDPEDELQLVIVRDMWLTGFDAPCLHTMYIDKPMSGHNLMQAIARVNRVFRDKPGGLVVDYIGIADSLKRALSDYVDSGGQGRTAIDLDEAAPVMLEKREIVQGILHGFDYSHLLQPGRAPDLSEIRDMMEFIVAQPEGNRRFVQAVASLSKAFALAVPHDQALAIREEVRLFQTIRAHLMNATTSAAERTPEQMEAAVRQLISQAISGEGVIDIFAVSGMERPDISILSDEFLSEVRSLPQRNLAVETLAKLLQDEIRTSLRRNVVSARAFSQLLEEALRKYHNRTVETVQVIEELIAIAREMRAAKTRGERLGLTEDETAFYDALASNESARTILGDETLKQIAQVLVQKVHASVTIDWDKRENARAHLRTLVKRILRKFNYPPDKQEQATQLVLEQTEAICREGLE